MPRKLPLNSKALAALLTPGVMCLKTNMRKLLIITLLLLSTQAHAQEYPLALKEWPGITAEKNTVYMTRGPKWYDEKESDEYNQKHYSDVSFGKFYRVYFIVNEIYYSLLIEELEYSGVEGSNIKTTNTYFITGFEIGEKVLKLHRLTNLKFVEWKSWDSFIIKESDTHLKIRLKPNGKITVERMK